MGDKPNTIVVTSRLDIRDLAVLASYLEKTGRLPTTKSLLIRNAIESLVGLLIRDKLAEPETSHKGAYETMVLLGLAPGDKARRVLMNEISREATTEELGVQKEDSSFAGLFE